MNPLDSSSTPAAAADRVEIRIAESEPALDAARSLFLEYAETLAFSLCFQDFDRELAELPGAYTQPRGALLLAWAPTGAAGCVAMRPLAAGVCEMKRLYVRPPHRALGLGRRLAQEVISCARQAGYPRMRLDTVPGMEAAQALYESLGFRPIPPYTVNPIPGARYLELAL